MTPSLLALNQKSKIQKLLILLLVASFFAMNVTHIFAQDEPTSSVYLDPPGGSYVVDDTFDVSIFLDTHGNTINTIELNLSYPPDKLQLVSSTTGRSIIGIWTSLPKFNNQTGTVELIGGVPGGVTSNQGLITTLTFRVKSVGSAIVKFNKSRVLLNDGFGTEVLTQSTNSVYNLVLPPPSGPLVSSDTHPDQTVWYNTAAASLSWNEEGGASGYSYILSREPVDIPDQISEGVNQELVYNNLSDGINYFHIRSLRGGVWGGTTHFAMQVDTLPPAEFPIEISPRARTNKKDPIIQFATTDAHSGVDHYELKIVPLFLIENTNLESDSEEFFVEAQSPFITHELEFGGYHVIVRAFDHAGNYREVVKKMDIVTTTFQLISNRGLEFSSRVVVPWYIVWILLLIILVLSIYFARHSHLLHRNNHHKISKKEIPDSLQQQLKELKKYKSKYGKLAVILFAVVSSMWFTSTALAQNLVLNPPKITTISDYLANDEIFYVGGRTGLADADVIVFLQNLQTAETRRILVPSDSEGEWFYRHDTFLSSGNYLLWAQSQIGEQVSPPGPQTQLTVEAAALEFGLTRFSFAAVYLIIIIILLIVLVSLISFIVYHLYHAKKKHAILSKNIQETENSINRGFAILNSDLKAELEVLKKAKKHQKLSSEDLSREKQLVNDLNQIEQHLKKEVWEIEQAHKATGQS